MNPSGKLAETIPYRETDVPGYGYFGTQGEQSRHLDDVEYRESLFVGYRYYDTFQVPVRYCFGYGLSYTDFVYSDLQQRNVILLNVIGFIIFFQGLMNLVIVVMINNTIEYDEARFHERHDSVISAVRSFSVKLAGGINQGLSTLVLIISGIYAKSRSISALEIEVNRGELSSEAALQEANQYINKITASQGLMFRLGMVLIPVLTLIVSYVIIRKRYHIDEAEYVKLIQEKQP